MREFTFFQYGGQFVYVYYVVFWIKPAILRLLILNIFFLPRLGDACK